MLREPRAYNGERVVSSTNGVKKTEYSRKMKRTPYLSSLTQKATRRGSDLNARPETVKLLAEHIRREPLNIALGSNFRI